MLKESNVLNEWESDQILQLRETDGPCEVRLVYVSQGNKGERKSKDWKTSTVTLQAMEVFQQLDRHTRVGALTPPDLFWSWSQFRTEETIVHTLTHFYSEREGPSLHILVLISGLMNPKDYSVFIWKLKAITLDLNVYTPFFLPFFPLWPGLTVLPPPCNAPFNCAHLNDKADPEEGRFFLGLVCFPFPPNAVSPDTL